MKRSVILALVLLSLTACTNNQYKSYKEYQNNINYSCTQDQDCVNKDIRNCCGYFPKCVNKNFEPNHELVSSLCQSEKTFSVCGFEEISSCVCSNNKCEAKQ